MLHPADFASEHMDSFAPPDYAPPALRGFNPSAAAPRPGPRPVPPTRTVKWRFKRYPMLTAREINARRDELARIYGDCTVTWHADHLAFHHPLGEADVAHDAAVAHGGA